MAGSRARKADGATSIVATPTPAPLDLIEDTAVAFDRQGVDEL